MCHSGQHGTYVVKKKPASSNSARASFLPATESSLARPVREGSPPLLMALNPNELSPLPNSSLLVGYSIGQWPYYEHLLVAMKKIWTLKGSLSLFTLANGFFLLKFTSSKDLEMIKIVDLPLALWTPSGISRIASYIGIPLTVDPLTTMRTRLTFARVCAQISKDLPLPDKIPIQIDGEELVFNVIYDWKSSKCEGCGSLIHPYSLCASNPNPKPIMPPPVVKHKGRSGSRNPRSRAPGSSSKPPSPSSRIPSTFHSPTSSPTLPPLSNLDKDPVLPNLNFPTEESSSSEQPSLQIPKPPPKVPLKNMFASLQTEELASHHLDESSIGGNPIDINHIDDNPKDINHMDLMSLPPFACWNVREFNTPEKVSLCKNLQLVVFDPWFINSHLILDYESSCNNFGFSNPGRIWLKWHSSHYSFSLTFSSSQIIHSILSAGSSSPIFLSVIYAAHNAGERKILWDHLRDLVPSHDQP
ncbi:hypothetical protein M5K25_024513 [Dendrobium thyrsiflorum]|uniref:DUF4283 domain-containing protein n=1 Tax=Dendrobium thyrsiflorum TaxID=117978 RepID=A0ABD0U233_DENTH